MIALTLSMQWYWVLVLLVYVAWFGFLAYASLKCSWKELKIGMKLLSVPGMAVFGAIDVVVLNWLIGTVLFYETPREWTFSQRCSRHLYSKGWRGWWAGAFSVPLNTIDSNHIR